MFYTKSYIDKKLARIDELEAKVKDQAFTMMLWASDIEGFVLKNKAIREILEEWYQDISNKGEEEYYNRILKALDGEQ